MGCANAARSELATPRSELATPRGNVTRTLPGCFVYVLDGIDNVAVAFSVRQLRSSYSGQCLRLRRSTDNAESDFGFVGGELDNSSISSWLSGATGFIRTWYDQSGNSRHAEQATTTRQPQYGANLQNGKPGLNYQSTTVGLATPSMPHFPSKRGTLNSVARRTGAGFYMLATYSQASPDFILYATDGVAALYKWYDGATNRPPSSADPDGVPLIHTLTRIGDTSVSYWRNGTLLGLPNTNADNQLANNPLIIGNRSTYASGLVGYFFEAIEFSAALPTADRQSIEASQATYFGIT